MPFPTIPMSMVRCISCVVTNAPITPTTAFRIGERSDDPLAMYLADVLTIPANLAGIPSVAVPCGFADGLPISLLRDGDTLRIDLAEGRIRTGAREFKSREPGELPNSAGTAYATRYARTALSALEGAGFG